MKSHEVPLTLTSFPRLGAPGVFTDPYYPPGGGVARSLFLPDEVTNQHVRFPCVACPCREENAAVGRLTSLPIARTHRTLTANIRRRRGSKVAINMPIFFDENTPRPFVDPTVPRDRNLWPEDANAREGAALDDHIYMDAMGFGMGCCCLQITFQACSVGEARRMYDAFVPVGPIMVRCLFLIFLLLPSLRCLVAKSQRCLPFLSSHFLRRLPSSVAGFRTLTAART